MNKNGFSFGPGAASLLLMAVLLSMSVLSILNLVASRNDERLGERTARVAEQVYGLNAAAESSLAQLDELLLECIGPNENEFLKQLNELLPEPFQLDDNIVRWTENDDESRMLQCAVRITNDPSSRYEWVEHRLITGSQDDGMEEFE